MLSKRGTRLNQLTSEPEDEIEPEEQLEPEDDLIAEDSLITPAGPMTRARAKKFN